MKTIEERFWSKVNVRDENDCWNWVAGIDTPGYGAFKFEGKKVNSHRLAWILTNGEIDDGLWVLHKCKGNRLCCNPNHLYLGDRSDNMKDAVRDETSNILTLEKPYGEKAGNSKLKESQVLEIRDKLKSGRNLEELSKEYSVDPRNVASIRDRKTWVHI